MAWSVRGVYDTVKKGIQFPLAQSISTMLFGGVGAGVRESFAGAWQKESRSSSATIPDRSPLQFSAVYTCINNISSDIAKLSMRILRSRQKGNGREPHPQHPLNLLLRKPNNYQTSLQFLQRYLTSKLWTGNTYVLFFRDARGVVSSMHVLDPQTTVPALTEDGSLWYMVKADRLNGLTEDLYIPARDILHDRAATLYHPLVGVSPLFAAAVSASIGNRISGHSDNFFKNMSRASGVISSPGEIPQPTADRLRKEWGANYSGEGFGKVAVLGSGLEWKALTMSAVEAQLIDQLRWSVEDIGRVYRVPAFMLGETKVTFRSGEVASRMYFNQCLSYHIEAIEQCFQLKFELDTSTFVEFDLSPLFRMETDLRYETHQKALQSGIKSINEVREEEDLGPVKGGETPRLQAQYVPIDEPNPLVQGNTPAPKPAPKPEPVDTPDPEDIPAPEPKPAKKQLFEESSEQDMLDLIERVRARLTVEALGVKVEQK